MATVQLENLRKRFGKTVAVDGLSLEVQDKEFFVLLGASGAGKTTTLKLIAGLENPTEGAILLNGKHIENLEPDERNVAMTFEAYALFPHYTVYDNLANPLRSPRYGLPPNQIDARVREVAEMLGISHILNHKPSEISGGQKQRTALGRSMVRRPQVFLFDEPLTHVDSKVRHRMRAELHRISSQLDTTTIYVTHDYAEALSLGDRIALLDHGRLIQMGTPRDLYDHPSTQHVGQGIGQPEMNLFAGVIRAGKPPRVVVDELGVEWPLDATWQDALASADGLAVRVGVRPQDLAVEQLPGYDASMPGSVVIFEPLGTKGVVTATTANAKVRLLVPPRSIFHAGQPLQISVNRSAIHLFDAASGASLWQPHTAELEAVAL